MSKKEINYSNPKELAKYIIENSPIGLLDSSIKSLKVLLKEEILNSTEILKAIKDYKEDHLMPISLKNVKSKVIMSSYNKDSDNFYYDQGQKIRFKLNAKCEEEKVEPYESKNETRKAIEEQLIEYINKYYNKKNIHYNVYYDSIVDKIFVLICGQIINEANYFNGEWLSIWESDLNDKSVSGEIRINTIYYEEGNVQFNLKKNYETKIQGNDFADELIKFIEKKENEIQKKLEKVNQNFSEDYIKPLRKRVSLIGSDMKWSLDQIQFRQQQNQ
jgi:capping protein alpha